MDTLVIAGKAFQSRLIVGTGKYKDGAETQRAIEASGAEMVTVAVRRVNLDRTKKACWTSSILSAISCCRIRPDVIPRKKRFAPPG